VTCNGVYYPRGRRSARLPGIEGLYAYCFELGAVLGRAPELLLRPEEELVADGAGNMPAVCRFGGAWAKWGSVIPDKSELVELVNCK
jgi:hypothetical protein